MQGQLTSSIVAVLPQWVARQRWYAGKGRVPVLRRIGGLRLEDPAGKVEIDIHLLVDESGRTPTTYQVPLTCRSTRLAGADNALVATVDLSGHGSQVPHGGEGTRYYYDAPHDPAFAAALLALMLDEKTVGSVSSVSSVSSVRKENDPQQGPDAGQSFVGAGGHSLATTDPGEVLTSRVLVGEQSNTSIILELVDVLGAPVKPVICKLFRILQHGQNPDVVVQSALSAAGSTLVPVSVGYVWGQWSDATVDGSSSSHLAFAQEFLPGVEDAWRVALAAVAAGVDFSERARSLGVATARVHATLAQTMGTREATADDVIALTRSMRARHAAALSEVPALADYDQLVRSSIEAVSSAGWPALQRIHGDYHLGQVLDAPGRGWVLVDFEGEPLRPLAERTQPDLPLRDVAGMLRSFDYVAGSWQQEHPGRSAASWADQARTAFLEGYAGSTGRDPRDDGALLEALELDKALYEVVYEARNRPTWLSIPITAIARLSAGRRSDLRS
jgi:maltokinase